LGEDDDESEIDLLKCEEEVDDFQK